MLTVTEIPMTQLQSHLKQNTNIPFKNININKSVKCQKFCSGLNVLTQKKCIHCPLIFQWLAFLDKEHSVQYFYQSASILSGFKVEWAAHE